MFMMFVNASYRPYNILIENGVANVALVFYLREKCWTCLDMKIDFCSIVAKLYKGYVT